MDFNMLIQSLLSSLFGQAGNPFTGNRGGFMQQNMMTPPAGFTAVSSGFQWNSNSLINMLPGVGAQMAGIPFAFAPQPFTGANPLDMAMMRVNQPGLNPYAGMYQSNLSTMGGAWGHTFDRIAANAGITGTDFQALGSGGIGTFGSSAPAELYRS